MAEETRKIGRLLTAQDVADLLQISDRSVWRLTKEGKLPPRIHVGRCARWPEDQIMAWIRLQGICG